MMKAPYCGALAGEDSYGQDILSRVIFGARYALIIGIFIGHDWRDRRLIIGWRLAFLVDGLGIGA